MSSKLLILEKEKKMWNIVLDQHGNEIDINVDKIFILDA